MIFQCVFPLYLSVFTDNRILYHCCCFRKKYIDDLLQVGILSSAVFDAKLNKFARPQQGQVMSIQYPGEGFCKGVWGDFFPRMLNNSDFLEKLWKNLNFVEFFHIKKTTTTIH